MQAVYGGQPNTMYPYVDQRGHYQGFARQVSISEPQPRPMFNGMNPHNVDINTDGPSYFYGGVPEAPASHHGTPFPHPNQMLPMGTPAGAPQHLPHPLKKHGRHASAPVYNPEPLTRRRTVSYKRETEEFDRPLEDMSSCNNSRIFELALI